MRARSLNIGDCIEETNAEDWGPVACQERQDSRKKMATISIERRLAKKDDMLISIMLLTGKLTRWTWICYSGGGNYRGLDLVRFRCAKPLFQRHRHPPRLPSSRPKRAKEAKLSKTMSHQHDPPPVSRLYHRHLRSYLLLLPLLINRDKQNPLKNSRGFEPTWYYNKGVEPTLLDLYFACTSSNFFRCLRGIRNLGPHPEFKSLMDLQHMKHEGFETPSSRSAETEKEVLVAGEAIMEVQSQWTLIVTVWIARGPQAAGPCRRKRSSKTASSPVCRAHALAVLTRLQ